MTELLFLPWRRLSRRERVGFVALIATMGVWLLLPRIAQDPAYHAFADRRSWLGVPNVADVGSSVAFLIVGVAGIVRLASSRRARFPSGTEASLWCVMLDLVATAFGSAWYHLAPDDATLVWDRLSMTLVFTGVIGAALAQRLGQNLARVALALLFGLGVASVVYWHATGDLSLYVTLQFGGIAALVLILAVTRGAGDPFPWWWVIGLYALAKVFEAGDRAIWDATHSLFAGHAWKHVAAAAAGGALLAPLRANVAPRVASGDPSPIA